ncbi:MAG: acetyl-CoA C-acetyltransferase [Candidatus Krumholzibacteria bacterium]|jgi:acetyl-CoA C-acetyltransferase|nr:acetyl-CoA C-acetyltransferase [Candidatus Krumholzibacteria bacterium]MDP6668308.1 acetyl-CoA C-acetyltransferase [Candidatus Krumholzibacteria bacterium]MDP6797675.1 acetyl-CoA C-acetyltransferase [Candidatus Krumholzibacteria bacterium]MDP7022112.1 acetyl-CoA C-acetyltransferase [Candidatus Krumholzibacteria bacterium]
MNTLRDVVILSAARTPIGSFLGNLSTVPAPKLGAIAIKGALERAGVPGEDVDEVIMGCVLPAGMGQAPARQATLAAGLPTSVECMTINKVCGSGLKSVMLAAQAIACGDADCVIAGGMENMSQVPHYLDGSREGRRMGDWKMKDGMVHDGLWDPYHNYHMGNAAELCARECKLSREEQDSLAEESYRRAQKSIAEGLFREEIVPVEIPQRRGDALIVEEDEEAGRVRFEKIPSLRPAFDPEGSVTAANASSINDGAAALLLMAAEEAEKRGLKPLAKIVSQASAAQDPEWFTTAPAKSVQKALERAGLEAGDIDTFELNEAFAVVSLVNAQLLELDSAKVNPRGGAVALGHPIGASGARILVTLLHTLKQEGGRRGLASLCIGGGEASTLIVEM